MECPHNIPHLLYYTSSEDYRKSYIVKNSFTDNNNNNIFKYKNMYKYYSLLKWPKDCRSNKILQFQCILYTEIVKGHLYKSYWLYLRGFTNEEPENRFYFTYVRKFIQD